MKKSIHFFKYQGTGNDFIMLDDRELTFPIQPEIITKLCDRRFGIGADGLILLRDEKGFDFRMIYFNSDGKEATMCGNGGRCITAFAKKIGIINEKAHFVASDGVHFAGISARAEEKTMVSLQMQDVEAVENVENDWFINTGTPHLVRFVENINDADVFREGREIRYLPIFGEIGTNVNFVQIMDKNRLRVRTYEKGVEDETLSCGTGVTASAIAASFLKSYQSFEIITRGGNLQVEFTKINNSFTKVWLKGPATFVFEGAYLL